MTRVHEGKENNRNPTNLSASSIISLKDDPARRSSPCQNANRFVVMKDDQTSRPEYSASLRVFLQLVREKADN
jgi:hypothetical protein